MGEHTKLPWNVRDHSIASGGRHIWVEGGSPIGETRAGPYKRQILEDEDYDEKAADAALIVKAVNSHADLVHALEEILSAEKEFREGMPDAWEGDPLTDACAFAREALAKASA